MTPQPSPLQLDLQPQAKVLMSVQYFLEDVGKPSLPGLGVGFRGQNGGLGKKPPSAVWLGLPWEGLKG